MRASKAIFLTVFLFLLPRAICAGNEKTLPFTFRADFENGSVGAWSSYPPAQDTAYDPTIWAKVVEGNPTKSLVREIVPNYAIESLVGVRKKLDLFVDPNSTLSFRFYVKDNGNDGAVIVKIGFADGLSRQIRIPVTAPKSWQAATVRFADVLDRDGKKRLEAIAFMAFSPKADPEALLRFAIDDVVVQGFRPVELPIREPQSDRLDEFDLFVSKTHFRQGEPVVVRGESPVPLRTVKASIVSAVTESKWRKLAVQMKKGGTWELRIPPPLVKAGMWKVRIDGTDAAGLTLSSRMVFLVKPLGSMNAHPRLLFSAREKKTIGRAIQSGVSREIWNGIKGRAEKIRKKLDPDLFQYNLDAYDEVYWLPTYVGYADTIGELATYARANGLVYSLTGDQDAGKAAKKALLRMSEWPSFVHPHILNQGQFTYWPVGLTLLDLALGYDWVYDLLTPAEREKIAGALYHKGITEVFREYVRDNRVSSNTSNWISHVTGGGILAAIAIADEFPDRELEPYLSGMILKLVELVKNTFDDDGDYGEGLGYHNFTMETLSEIIPVLEANFGIQFPEKVFRSHQYMFYQLDPQTKEFSDFGDTHSRLGQMTNFAYVLRKNRDPHLKWLYELLGKGTGDNDLFFADPSISAKDPSDLPPVKLFRDVGTAVFRSGFKHEDFAFIFRCGPFYNHQHFDQGGFFLNDRGENLIGESGRTNYYNDPWYNKLFIQPGGHSCILVDENPESQRAGDLLHDVKAWQDYARITDFIEFKEGAFVSGDLAPIYKGKFKVLRRSVLYLKPRTIVMIDQGIGEAGARAMNLRFQAARENEIRVNGTMTEIRKPSASLYIKTISPGDYRNEIRKRPLTLDEYSRENPVTMSARGFVQLTAPLATEGTVFINVFSTDGKVMNGLQVKDSGDVTELSYGGARYFVNRRMTGPVWIGNVETDALVYSRLNGRTLLCRVSSFAEGGRKRISLARPASLIRSGKE